MKKVLVTGASGFLGGNIVSCLNDKYQVYGTYNKNCLELDGCEMRQFSLGDDGAARELISGIKPDAVLHTAAMTSPDQCEVNREEAYRINIEGTEQLALETQKSGAKFIFISTDLVYDGSKGDHIEEEDANPLSHYAQTKLLGESKVRRSCKNHVIIRVALLYGRGNEVNRSFTDRMFENLIRGKEIKLFTDQYRTPILVSRVVEVLDYIIQNNNLRGLFNLGGGERVNRYNFGLKFCGVFGLDESLLKPIEMRELQLSAARPKDCSLNSHRISSITGIRLQSIEEGFKRMKNLMPEA